MKNIEHLAEIISIEGYMVEVKMVVSSACVSCQAKTACGVSESVDKRVDVFVEDPSLFEIGDNVMVTITQSMGMKAVLYAYILPFVLLLSSLLLTLNLGFSESVAGLTSLGVVGFYYVGLYLMRDKLDREIIFNLRRV